MATLWSSSSSLLRTENGDDWIVEIAYKFCCIRNILGHMNEDSPPPRMKASWWRFLVIILASLLLFGNMYAFDNPQALEDSLEKELNIT
jgi:hypothetical protein